MVLITFLLFCAGCASPRGIGSGPDAIPNGCLVQCVYASQRLSDAGSIRSRVIGVQRGKKQPHAITAFWYRGQTYVYDPAAGSAIAAPHIEKDPLTIALACPWLGATGAKYLSK